MTGTFGPDYDEAKDGKRIATQLGVIHAYMMRQAAVGSWRSLAEIERATEYPQASISAQLRHLRKRRFGSWVVSKRRRSDEGGTWEYRLSLPLPKGQLEMF